MARATTDRQPHAQGRDPAIHEVLESGSGVSLRYRPAVRLGPDYSAADYRPLMLSYSGIQIMTEADRIGLLYGVESLIHNDFGGRITRPLVVTLTTGVLTQH